MRRIHTMRALGVIAVPLLIVAASPRESIEDIIRRGNDAFAAKQYRSAVQLYQQAEGLTPDPGLVAFNKASALYQLALAAQSPAEKAGRFHEAEEAYRCAADDATQPRRLLARFGLANSLLQGRAEDADSLKQAVACYRECLTSDALDDSLKADARHNLEVAKLKLLKVQSKPPSERAKDPGGEDKPKKPDKKEPKKEPKPPQQGGDPMKDAGQPKGSGDPAEVKDGQKPIPTPKTEAGGGTPQPIKDDSSSPPLTAKEAETALKAAVKEIQDRQERNRLRGGRTPAGAVKDW